MAWSCVIFFHWYCWNNKYELDYSIWNRADLSSLCTNYGMFERLDATIVWVLWFLLSGTILYKRRVNVLEHLPWDPWLAFLLQPWLWSDYLRIVSIYNKDLNLSLLQKRNELYRALLLFQSENKTMCLDNIGYIVYKGNLRHSWTGIRCQATSGGI